MKSLNYYLSEYSKSHKNSTNKDIHSICVPLIVFSIIGILMVIPTPWDWSVFLNWSSLLVIFATFYYFLLSLRYALIVLPFVYLMYALNLFLYADYNLPLIAGVIFIISWIGQFIGHKIEGAKPSFLQDLSFLLIGPLWVTKHLLKLKD